MIEWDDSLKKYLLQGAQIISYWEGRYECTILIRLPKDNWYLWGDAGDIKFEYIAFQLLDGKIMYHAVSHNGSKREVIKRVAQNHYEDEFMSKRIAEKKQK